MKISASVYSNKSKSPEELVKELDALGVDYIHIDCNDDASVFEDIAKIKAVSKTPIDLHIISTNPEKYNTLIEQHKVDFVTFQYENIIKHPVQFPKNVKARGLSVISETSVDVFEAYKNQCDFILVMTTTPGQSGGAFNKSNFNKIRAFQKKYPSKKVHVDGGVNDEIAFVLRNYGVDSVVSGSYLVNADTLGTAMHNLRKTSVNSNLKLGDVVIEKSELPILNISKASFKDILLAIENYGLGFVMFEDDAKEFKGICTNADVRRALIKHYENISSISISELVNATPVAMNENDTISAMLSKIKSLSFSVLFMPVITSDNKIKGAIMFNNLIKGEL